MSQLKAYVRLTEVNARSAGITLGMAKLRDAISRALFDRSYSAAMAAEKAGKLPALVLPPEYLEATAKTYRLDPVTFGNAFAPLTADTTR